MKWILALLACLTLVCWAGNNGFKGSTCYILPPVGSRAASVASGPPETIPSGCVFYLDNSDTQSMVAGSYPDVSARGSSWGQATIAARPAVSNIGVTAGNALLFDGVNDGISNKGSSQAQIELPNILTNPAGFVVEWIMSGTQNVSGVVKVFFTQGIGGTPQASASLLDVRVFVTATDIGNQIMDNQWPNGKLGTWSYYVWRYAPNSSLCYANATNAATPDTSLTIVNKELGNNKLFIGSGDGAGYAPFALRQIAGYTNPAVWTPLFVTNRYNTIKASWPGLGLP